MAGGVLVCYFFVLFFVLASVLMHFVQAKTRLPSARRAFCKLGYFLVAGVGLYLPRSFFLPAIIIDPFPQISHWRIKLFQFKLALKEPWRGIIPAVNQVGGIFNPKTKYSLPF